MTSPDTGKANPVSQHFVTFYSPGTFVSEESARPIDSWDVVVAVEMARTVSERHGATPYGFRFSTRSRGPDDLDSHVSAKSNFYWLGGTVRTAEEVLASIDPSESVLRSNVRMNGFRRIMTNDNSWRFTGSMNDDDMVLPFAPAISLAEGGEQ